MQTRLLQNPAGRGQPLCLVSPVGGPEGSPGRPERRVTRVVKLKPHERLWRQGDLTRDLALVCSGLLAWRHHARREVLLDVLRPGDLVGEPCPDDGATQPFEVEAIRRAVVVLFPLRALHERMARRPELGLKLLQRFSESTRRLTGRVGSLSQGDVARRLADVLLHLADRFGEPFDGGVLVPLKLGREDLAAMSATTQESVSRKLGAWRRARVVEPQPLGYLLRDSAALRRLVEDGG